MQNYPAIQQFRIWDSEIKDFVYSGGTPMMLADFFKHTARLHTMYKMPYQKHTSIYDKGGKNIFEGDIINVYLAAEYQHFDDTDNETERGDNEHYNKTNAFVCKQEVKWAEYSGYFCEEDTGEYCPPLGDSDELVLEKIGDIYTTPHLLTP